MNRYCDPTTLKFRTKFVKEYKGCTHEEELRFLLNKYFMVRRLKKDVLKELPPKIRSKFILADLDQSAMSDVRRLEQQLASLQNLDVMGEDDVQSARDEVKQTIMEWWRMTSKAKQGSVCD